MPVYEYECEEHGLFEQQRAMRDSSASAVCPDCHLQAARVLSAPGLRRMASSEIRARDRNERSAHEPTVAVRPTGQARPTGPAVVHPGQVGRPWMLGHG